jgi:hypothetical protein
LESFDLYGLKNGAKVVYFTILSMCEILVFAEFFIKKPLREFTLKGCRTA